MEVNATNINSRDVIVAELRDDYVAAIDGRNVFAYVAEGPLNLRNCTVMPP
jgi:hypothetical protein